MDKYIGSEIEQDIMTLQQMGADVKTISSKMVYVTFPIAKNIRVSYVFNVNKRNKYFVERIHPYPIVIKEFETAKHVIDLIQIDLEQFKKAVQNDNFADFVQINRNLHNAILQFEELFLYYDVDKKHIQTIEDSVKTILNEIKITQNTSKRIYFEKDPEHL